MNDDLEVTQEERLHDLAQAYVQLRESARGSADPAKASAMAQLSIAITMIEREGYAEGEYEEDEDGEDEEEV
jgi:hypothetical protein